MREAAPTFIRWLWVWITIAALVVVVVIGFLIGIVSSLSAIDDNLFEADAAVTGIGGDAEPLPDAIETINKNLTLIDASLEPIPGQADAILGELGSIRGKLGNIDASLGDTDASLENTDASLVDTNNQLGNITSLLVDTSGTLVTISGSLDDTSGTLQGISPSLDDTSGTLEVISPSLEDTSGELISIRRLTDRIDRTLEDAQRSRATEPASSAALGPNDNPNGLEVAEADATAILGGLQEVNTHLRSICEAPVLQVPIPLFVTPGPCGDEAPAERSQR